MSLLILVDISIKIVARHWNFSKSKELAKLDIETFIKCGGYPDSYPLIQNRKSWESYIQNSIVDTVIGKDILSFSKVRKPVLFRQ